MAARLPVNRGAGKESEPPASAIREPVLRSVEKGSQPAIPPESTYRAKERTA